MKELLPCPFCGSEDVTFWSEHNLPDSPSVYNNYVGCEECGAFGPEFLWDEEDHDESLEECQQAVRVAWNMRHIT